MIKVNKYKPTFSRTDLPVPPLDFRRDVKTRSVEDKEKSWLILQQTHREALQAYQLCISKILSRVDGLSTIAIKEILLFEWLISNKVADDAVMFLLKSKEVEIEESTTQGVNLDLLYRAPRIKVSISGPYSPYVPQSKV
jgi:hypothetical protein